MRHLRGLFVALAVLALSAGAALAGLPQAAADGLARATQASGRTVPVRPDVVPDVQKPDAAAEDEATETPDEQTEQEPEQDVDHPDNHGADVAEAAQGETPEGWRNHGAYVSAVARGLVQPGDPAPQEAVDNGGLMPKPEKPSETNGAETSAAAKAAHGKPDGTGKPDSPGKPTR